MKNGVGRGDRVVIYADNTVECVVSFWAVLKANAVVSFVLLAAVAVDVAMYPP